MNNIVSGDINNEHYLEKWLNEERSKKLLRVLTCGSIDDGKSTLIGRLLHDTHQIYEDHLMSLINQHKPYTKQKTSLNLALLVDGLQAEIEQGITIDVAYRYFYTSKCKFIIADTPGHEQYTRNMATGASTSELAILLIDAKKGMLDQTRRHSFIVTLLGIKHLIVAINKMDLVEYSEIIFNNIKNHYLNLSIQLPQKINIHFIPISALQGDNVVIQSNHMTWYKGKTLLHVLETIEEENINNNHQLPRFPIQYVNKIDENLRSYSGTLAAGVLKVGQRIKVLPSSIESIITRIITFNGDLNEVTTGHAVALVLKNEIDISRGDLLIDAQDDVQLIHSALVNVVWMVQGSLKPDQIYDIKVANKKTRCSIKKIIYQIDINTLNKKTVDCLPLNGIGLVQIIFDEPMALDIYGQNKITGGIIFMDRMTNITVGAGMIEKLIPDIIQYKNQYSNFELELNSLIRRYFPHWHTSSI